MRDLAQKRCKACNKDTPRLTSEQQGELAREIPRWDVTDGRLQRRFVFRDFWASIRFVDEMALVAESEGHHPVFTVDYDKVDVAVWTHAIGALSENDFILAAKLDRAATDLGVRQ